MQQMQNIGQVPILYNEVSKYLLAILLKVEQAIHFVNDPVARTALEGVILRLYSQQAMFYAVITRWRPYCLLC